MVRNNAIPPDALARQEMLSRAATRSNAEADAQKTGHASDQTHVDSNREAQISLKQGAVGQQRE